MSASNVSGEVVVANPPDNQPLKITSTPVPSQEGKNEQDYSEFIPEDLLFALTEVNSLLKSKQEELAPLKTLKTPKEMRMALKKGVPDSVWHHKNRRLHFRHLTDNPKSCGKTAGSKDISFLYDVSSQKKQAPEMASRYDKSVPRLRALSETKSSGSNLAVPDSIIPDEYHLLKSKAVIGLDYVDDKMTTNLADQEKALRVFPSLKPTKRFEVIQLMKTMDQMLSKAGVDNIENEAKGPTQIHNLLEIIKKEQQIYDIVFHEVIRQVSIDCVERGQLISKLRQRYADLLNRIPRQIKSLHAEVMAQRSLDRRLTEELLRFKTSIGNLTDELISVREHDKRITKDAEIAQLDLEEALTESQKNADLVEEYHDLYELQRNRLEKQVETLTEERDLWCNASYSLALKIISENSLSTAKRLYVTEKSWHKLAAHFNVLISDHDTESLVELQTCVEAWRDMIFRFHQVLEAADKGTCNILNSIKDGLLYWIAHFEDNLISVDGDNGVRSIKLLSTDMFENLQADIAHWEQQLSENSERFGGDTFLNNQEQLIKMTKEVSKWTDTGIIIYDRHQTDSGKSYHQRPVMSKNNELFDDLKKHLQIRITGENGAAKGMIALQNNLDTWGTKLVVSMRGAEVVSDMEWFRFFDSMHDYVTVLDETIASVTSVPSNEETESGRITIEKMIEEVQKWLKDTVNGIEGENGKMAAQVSFIHTSMVHWMVQLLLLLAPDKANRIPVESSLTAGCSVEELVKKSEALCDHLSRTTSYICLCADNIVQLSTQQKRDAGEENADHEFRDFIRIQSECKEWIRTCQLLINTLREQPATMLDEAVLARLRKRKPKKTTTVKLEEVTETVADEKVEVQGTAEMMEKNIETSAQPSESVKDVEIVEESDVEVEEEFIEPKMTQSLEVMGADENVEYSTLDELQQVGNSISQAGMSDILTPPSSTLTQSAYDAIAKMDNLQQQLLSTEKRAQKAESKCLDLGDSLNKAKEDIRALERQITDMEKEEHLVKLPESPKPLELIPADKPSTSQKSSSPDRTSKVATPDPVKKAASSGGEKKKAKSKKK